MRRQRIVMLAVLAVVALIAIPVVISQAAKRKSHDVDATALVGTVKSLSGGRSIGAAYVTGKPYGKSAAILRATATNNADGTATVDGKFIIYNRHGTVKGTAEGKLTPTTGGNATFDGDGEATDGTGKYKDATGPVQITGTYNSGTGVLTLKATGTVKY
jgi:hypothetical protein